MPRSTRPGRRSPEEWQAVISRQEQSGLSRLTFCRREGILSPTFDKWKRRLLARRSVAEFVDLTPSSPDPASWNLEVALPNGVVLRFRG